MFLFPFLQIPYNKKVVIWGMGDMGKDFLYQLRESKYAELVATIDSFSEEAQMRPEEFFRSKIEYDYLIISISKYSIQAEIRRELIQNGVPTEKIILPFVKKIDRFENLSYRLTDIMDKKSRKEVCNRFIHERIQYPRLFYNIINDISNIEDREKSLETCLNSSERMNPQSIILICYLFIEAGYFSPFIVKTLLKSINMILDLNMRFLLLTDVSLLNVQSGNVLYKGFYEDLRGGYLKLINDAKLTFDLKKEKGNSVVILFNGLGKELSYTDFRYCTAEKLHGEGYDVHILCLDIRMKDESYFIYPYDDYIYGYDSSKNSKNHKDVFGEIAKIHYVKGKTTVEKMQNALDVISDISPCKVVDMSDEMAPFVACIINDIEIDCRPWRTHGTSMVCSYISYRNLEKCKEFANRYYRNKQPKYKLVNISRSKLLPKRKHTKNEYNCKEKYFVITSVGGRLNTEMTKEFIDCVCAFLAKNTEIAWILVGIPDNIYIRFRYNDLVKESRILFIPYEPDISGYYEICDAFINPPRTGGGRVIQAAIEQNLEVYMTDIVLSDANEIVPAEFVFHTVEEQIEAVSIKYKREKENIDQ